MAETSKAGATNAPAKPTTPPKQEEKKSSPPKVDDRIERLEGMVEKLLTERKVQEEDNNDFGNIVTLESKASYTPWDQELSEKLTLDKAVEIYDETAEEPLPKDVTPLAFGVRGFPGSDKYLVIALNNGTKRAVEYTP